MLIYEESFIDFVSVFIETGLIQGIHFPDIFQKNIIIKNADKELRVQGIDRVFILKQKVLFVVFQIKNSLILNEFRIFTQLYLWINMLNSTNSNFEKTIKW